MPERQDRNSAGAVASPDRFLPSKEVICPFLWSWGQELNAPECRVPNSPTGQVLEAGPGWPVLVMAMTGPD